MIKKKYIAKKKPVKKVSAQTKKKAGGKVSTTITIATEIDDYIEENRVPTMENRSYSNMAETLMMEAMQARQLKAK